VSECQITVLRTSVHFVDIVLIEIMILKVVTVTGLCDVLRNVGRSIRRRTRSKLGIPGSIGSAGGFASCHVAAEERIIANIIVSVIVKALVSEETVALTASSQDTSTLESDVDMRTVQRNDDIVIADFVVDLLDGPDNSAILLRVGNIITCFCFIASEIIKSSLGFCVTWITLLSNNL